MIRLFFIVLLASCTANESNNGKSIRKLLVDEKLEKLLQEDLSNSEDSVFTLIVQNENEIKHLRFYATNEVMDTFQYVGYFYCNDVLFLYRNEEVNKENVLNLVSKSNEFKTFSTTALKRDENPYPDDVYYLHYIYKDKILSRVLEE